MPRAIQVGPMREQTHLTPALCAKFNPSQGHEALDGQTVLTIQNPNQTSLNSASR
jgi:hypothetical protein